MTLESLLGDEDLTITIKDLVTASGRSYPGIEGVDVEKDFSRATQISAKKQIGNGVEKTASLHLNGNY